MQILLHFAGLDFPRPSPGPGRSPVTPSRVQSPCMLYGGDTDTVFGLILNTGLDRAQLFVGTTVGPKHAEEGK